MHLLTVCSCGPLDGGLDQFSPLEGGHDVLVNTLLAGLWSAWEIMQS